MGNQNIEQILKKLPEELADRIRGLAEPVRERIEEIRIKIGAPVLVYSGGIEYEIALAGGRRVDKDVLNGVFHSILNHSVYAYQEELANGYVTIEGGHRAGICGKAVVEDGRVRAIKDISSLNIRRSREIIGVSDPYFRYLMKNSRQMYNTVIVSPPKCGKTTLLRDVIRNLSSCGIKTGVCDERSELSGSYHGEISYDLGMRTDVLDGCPKADGMIMLIRAMSPDVIATDEIGKKEDIPAIEAALCAGIGLLTTIHGSSYEELIRSGIGELVKSGVFERIVFLSNHPKIGTVTDITDAENQSVLSRMRI